MLEVFEGPKLELFSATVLLCFINTDAGGI